MKSLFKNISVLLLAGLSYGAFAQDKSMPLAVQGGVGHLNKGVCTISLNEQMPADGYYVSVTPHSAANTLYVVKNGNSFDVIEKAGKRGAVADADFDYVIFKNTAIQPQAVMIKSRVAPSTGK